MSEQRISIPFFMAFNVGHIGCLYLTLLANGVKWLHFDKQNKKIKTLKRNHAFHCLPACGTRIVQGGIKKKLRFPLQLVRGLSSKTAASDRRDTAKSQAG